MIPPSPASSAANLSELAEPSVVKQHVKISLWEEEQEKSLTPPPHLFTNKTVAIIWGMQPRAVQVGTFMFIYGSMLICSC